MTPWLIAAFLYVALVLFTLRGFYVLGRQGREWDRQAADRSGVRRG